MKIGLGLNAANRVAVPTRLGHIDMEGYWRKPPRTTGFSKNSGCSMSVCPCVINMGTNGLILMWAGQAPMEEFKQLLVETQGKKATRSK